MNSDEQSPGSKPETAGRSGILTQTTPADRGIVEVPLLAPHLDFRRVEHDKILLVSETFNTILDGPCSAALVPLLDGTRSRRELAAALADRHSAIDVQTTLVFLASKGYVVSGEFTMDRALAAFWSALGVSPRRAAERLAAAPVAVTGDDSRLAQALARLGVTVSAVEPLLCVVVCADYLDEPHAETNRRHLASGEPWTLVRAGGVTPLFGPIFRPAAGGPCWACLAHRLRHNREVDQFLRHVSGAGAAIGPGPMPTVLRDRVYWTAAVEIAKWLVLAETAALHDRVVSVDNLTLETAQHRVVRRPQCRACGEAQGFRPDRPAVPVTLHPSPKPVWNSGGVRAVAPDQTLRKYRHLISPVSGVVAHLERQSDEADPWFHVYWASSNHLGPRASTLRLLYHSLKGKSSGKGSTPEQSAASAVGEAIERYSGGYFGEEIHCRRRFADFAEAPVMDAIHPNDVMLFSDLQYAHGDAFNDRYRADYVPVRFDPTAEIDWSPVWSFTQGRHRYLPTSLLYYRGPAPSGASFCKADSNGCASGNTLEEAILQGFFELVERDAFATWWYNRVRRPAVALDSFDDEYLEAARDNYRAWNRDLWVLDVTNDVGIPTFVAISAHTEGEADHIIHGAGAHFDPHIAVLRAVCELNQCLYGVLEWKADGTEPGNSDNSIFTWGQESVTLADNPYLRPDPAAPPRRKTDYTVPATTDVKEDVERCIALVEDKGMEFLVLDQTRPDIGMPVARVIVPGMRHFWPRFAPGRLYDVPVAMGWLDAPHAETGLNPVPIVI